MADGLVWDHVPERLRRPVLVAGFEGWNDAADAASSAASWLSLHGAKTATPVASIDPEMHFDFQSRRAPTSSSSTASPEGSRGQRTCSPRCSARNATSSCSAGSSRATAGGRSARPCSRSLGQPGASWWSRSGPSSPTSRTPAPLGSPAPRPTPGSSSDSASRRRPTRDRPASWGCSTTTADRSRCRRCRCGRRSRTTSRRPPNPPATLALLDRFGALCGIAFDLDRLARTGAVWRTKVDEVAAADDDVSGYVPTLEERYDQEVAAGPEWGEDLPSGDELATEVERYLREQRGD